MCALALVVLSALLSLGCVARSSASGPLSIEGRLLNAGGDPMEGVRVEVLLPKAYGIRANELGAGQAMDFTHPRRLLQLVTDSRGEFAGDLGNHSYAVDVWVFPPRGPLPSAPPAPAVLIRTPGLSNENYYVCTEKGACIVMQPNGATIPTSESRLVRSSATARTVSGPGTGTEARIELVFDYAGERELTAVLPPDR